MTEHLQNEPSHSTEPQTALMDLRRDYKLASLNEADLHKDPFSQFAKWFQEAQKAALLEPNAMTLATVNESGKPSARIVLLKGFDARGFCFYTNYQSAKGRELEGRPYACLVFLWQELERQVRVEGMVHKMSPQESDQYFNSRPLNSRYGALVSPQSEIIKNRQVLVELEAKLRIQYGENPPRPAHWGGYRLAPEVVEFWQGRRSRLHDRLRFSRSNASNTTLWNIDRLAP
jgi:pyridoxamine 5'-phosphate oxidase